MRDVLLVTPPYHCGMVESAGVWMPLQLAYLAGALRDAGYEPRIHDAMSLYEDLDGVRAHVASRPPDVVAVTACTASVNAALGVLASAREAAPAALTVIGGVHPTFMAAEVLGDPCVDFVVRGEGETTLAELLACLEAGESAAKVAGISYRETGSGGVVHTPDRPLAADLDALPVAWDLIDWPLYHYRTKPGSRLAVTSWARGCTGRCSFCSQHKMWRGCWRARRPEAVVAEVRMLAERFGVDTLEVADEYPTSDAARWEWILDRLIAEDLGVELLIETRADDIVRDERIIGTYRDAGVLHTYVGVESVRQDRLDRMRKGTSVAQGRRAIGLLNDAGIITETSFLLGYPEDTVADVDEALRLGMEYAPDLAFFLAVTPWPYADLYAEVADRVEVHDYSRYNLIEPIIRPAVPRDELAEALSRAFVAFYTEKMRSLHSMPPEKRAYMMRVSKLLMGGSYLSEEVATSLRCAATSAVADAGDPPRLEVVPG
jgi:anaerobic magnesium-protoporphyrin IX monomethyl ester cyclase